MLRLLGLPRFCVLVVGQASGRIDCHPGEASTVEGQAWLRSGAGEGRRQRHFGCGMAMIVLTLPGLVGQLYSNFGRGTLMEIVIQS